VSARALAVFDLDGTITRHDSLLPFVAGFLWRHPARWPRFIATIPLMAAYVLERNRGALKGAIIHVTFGGLTRAEVDAYAAQFVPRLLRRGLYAEALTQIAAHRARADHLVLLSASPDLYVAHIGTALGFDETLCSEVRWHPDGRLDGRLATPNRRGDEKLRCLHALIARLQPSRLYAYGNSSADLAHMQLATEASYVNGHVRDLDERCAHIRVVRWTHHGGV